MRHLRPGRRTAAPHATVLTVSLLAGGVTGGARIRAGLPTSWTVGDKTGTGSAYGAANDIAVVRPGGSAAPVIMAIYTNRRAAGADVDNAIVASTATVLARGLGRL